MKKQNICTTLATIVLATVGLAFGTTQVAQASSVNNYISSKNIKPAKITSAVWKGFPKYKYRHGKGKPEGVVVHETANNNSTLYNEVAYMKRNYKNAFVHSFVDGSKIVNIANTDYLSWGVGYPGNARFIQFEQVRVHSKSAFAHEIANSAYYTAYLLNKYNLKPNDAAYDGNGTVWSHQSVAKHLGGSDHTDPVDYYKSNGKKYFGSAYTMSEFYKLVKSYYNNLHGSSNNGSITSHNNNSKLQKATYVSGTGNEVAKVTKIYKNNVLYNHLKKTRKNVKSYKWPKNVKAGSKVWVDQRATRTDHSQWYRIRFSASNKAKRYWVYNKSVQFPSASYKASSQTLRIKDNVNDYTRDHVFDTHLLSKKVTNLKYLGGQTYTADAAATITDNSGKFKTYYRIYINDKAQWIYANETTNSY